MAIKELSFVVKVQYEDHEDGVICEDSMKDNLFSAIENERVEGGLTPNSISANWIDVHPVKTANVVIKQNEHGGFDVAASDEGPVRIVLAESDLTGEPNLKIDGEDCIAWDVVADSDSSRVDEILKTYI